MSAILRCLPNVPSTSSVGANFVPLNFGTTQPPHLALFPHEPVVVWNFVCACATGVLSNLKIVPAKNWLMWLQLVVQLVDLPRRKPLNAFFSLIGVIGVFRTSCPQNSDFFF